MANELNLYKVLPKYIDALRDEALDGDPTIYIVDGKEKRPFIGIVAIINGYYYFVPLTRYKPRFHYLTNKGTSFIPPVFPLLSMKYILSRPLRALIFHQVL